MASTCPACGRNLPLKDFVCDDCLVIVANDYREIDLQQHNTLLRLLKSKQ